MASATQHPAVFSGRVAVITGGASGIGLAAAKRFAALGMKVVIADVNDNHLAEAHGIVAAAGGRPADVKTVKCDVSNVEDVKRLKHEAITAFGEVAVLMNNAGITGGAGPLEKLDTWHTTLAVNLFGVLNGVQVFAEDMIAQGTPAVIINTGSKQGITCPPGNTAYNTSKAGVKVLTEGLQHTLRNTPSCQVSAHLLIPGYTFTGMTAAAGTEKPAAAWSPEQVVEFMLGGLAAGTFYILCPDNETPRRTDERRMLWAAGDIVHNRPALSRWHPDYKDSFAAFLAEDSV
eukprot:TRINITY_DN1420_c0_g1_i1.p1 TRINITY_DN1420_c0_g1~~TRINITY_DN1420_c0_g1_i1.p1  ORF type:complete len:289 (-),score=112.01 TRINITY_DN1420_c0_g1_i1:268-1134(-)